MSSTTTDQIINAMMGFRALAHKSHARRTKQRSFVHVIVLHYIQEAQQPTMKEIASFLRVTMPSASVIIADLVRARLVERIADRADKRIIRIRITVLGTRVMKKQLIAAQKTIRDRLQVLSALEQRQFLKILTKLRHHLSVS